MPISHRDLMLATSASKPFSKPGWIFEPKYDGYRILARNEGGQARLVTRNGIDLAGYFPEIASELAAMPEAVIDGEVVILDPGACRSSIGYGHASLDGVAHRIGPSLKRGDLRFRPPVRSRRGPACPTVDRAQGGPAAFVEKLRAHPVSPACRHGEALYRHFEQLGLEGVVGKRADAPYRAGRTEVWKKVKTPAFKAIEAKRLEHIRK